MCEVIVCKSCGFEESYHYASDPPPAFAPEQQLRQWVPAYSQDMILAAGLRRQLEGMGWRIVNSRRGNGVACTASKGDVSVATDMCPTDESAITRAVAELIRRKLVNLHSQ